jgi:hypothetical protein
MSRSNPNENSNPNPATRWFEWNGEQGTVRYYDRETKQNIEVGSDFSFVLLDQLGTVGGWHDESDSGIYANEAKDTRQDVLVVKAFKQKNAIAEGLYRDIKDRVNAAGGQFVANCYIAFKDGGELKIGSLKFKGAALHAWTEFAKGHRADLYKKGVRIQGFTEGKKGRIVFRVPVLKLVDLSEASNTAAIALDGVLQDFLKSYLKRTTSDRVDAAAAHVPDEDMVPTSAYEESGDPVDLTDDDIPF